MINTIRQDIWETYSSVRDIFRRPEPQPLEAGEFRYFTYRQFLETSSGGWLYWLAGFLVLMPIFKYWNEDVTLSWQLWIACWLSAWPHLTLLLLYVTHCYIFGQMNPRLRKLAKAHENVVVEVDRNTIRWTSGEHTVLTLWEDVQSVCYEPGPRWREHHGVLTIKATTGSFQIVPAAISAGKRLESIIRLHAPAAALMNNGVDLTARGHTFPA